MNIHIFWKKFFCARRWCISQMAKKKQSYSSSVHNAPNNGIWWERRRCNSCFTKFHPGSGPRHESFLVLLGIWSQQRVKKISAKEGNLTAYAWKLNYDIYFMGPRNFFSLFKGKHTLVHENTISSNSMCIWNGGMRHTSTAQYFFGASKRCTEDQSQFFFLIQRKYVFMDYLQLLYLKFLSYTYVSWFLN